MPDLDEADNNEEEEGEDKPSTSKKRRICKRWVRKQNKSDIWKNQFKFRFLKTLALKPWSLFVFGINILEIIYWINNSLIIDAYFQILFRKISFLELKLQCETAGHSIPYFY